VEEKGASERSKARGERKRDEKGDRKRKERTKLCNNDLNKLFFKFYFNYNVFI